MSRLFTRSIRPPDELPNSNDPASVPPATVGPPSAAPGDPHGVMLLDEPGPPALPLPTIAPSAWSGWPASWWPPAWGSGGTGGARPLGDTAWMCIDTNANALSSMPPYLVNAPASLDAQWLVNPDPDEYTSWEEFAKQLFWEFQLGEAFVLSTARYATGWPARFHVVPGFYVNVEFVDGRRVYRIGAEDVTADILHVRYKSSVGDAHGHGPLEAGWARTVAADVLLRYATGLVSNGGIPTSILRVQEEQSPEQAAQLKADWVQARISSIGEPAVLTGGIEWEAVQLNPEQMALVDLEKYYESRIAVLLGVPPFMVGLPSGADTMTYSNVSSIYDDHWRRGLRPKARHVMSALSGWLLPRGVRVEVNSDFYVQPGPLERAQADEILARIVDPDTGQPAKTVAEIREQERFDNGSPAKFSEGVLS